MSTPCLSGTCGHIPVACAGLPVLCPWNPHLRAQVRSLNSTDSSGLSGVFSGIVFSCLSGHFIYSASCVLAFVSWIYFPIIQLRKHHHCFLCSTFLRVPWTEKKSNLRDREGNTFTERSKNQSVVKRSLEKNIYNTNG